MLKEKIKLVKFPQVVLALTLVLLLAYGFFLRIYQLASQSYWIDEGYTLNAVEATLKHGYPILDSGRHYSDYLLNTYLISLAIKIGGFNPWSGRILSVILGTGVILLIYFLTKKLLNSKVALLAAILTTFSYWEIAWSRQARMYIQLQFFFFLSLYLFLNLFQKFSYRKLIILIVVTIATILSHPLGWLLFGIYFLVAIKKIIIYLIKKRVDTKRELGKIKETIKKFILTNLKLRKFFFLALSLTAIIFVCFKIISYLIVYWQRRAFYIGYSFQNFLVTNIPLILLLAILGIFWMILKEKNISASYFLLISYLLPYLVVTFTTDLLHFRYIFFISPILFILASYFLYSVANYFHHSTLGPALLIIIVILLSIRLADNSFTFKPKINYWLEPYTPQPNFQEAYNQIKQNGWDKDKVIISPFPQMDKIYLGQSDYWIAVSLSGKKKTLKNTINKETNREIYANAYVIDDPKILNKVIEEKDGYLIVDDMALGKKMNYRIIQIIREQKLLWADESTPKQRIWVYKI
jgi:uncharacterized membrane protein